jgi:sugar phosphate isomerase/epimerase
LTRVTALEHLTLLTVPPPRLVSVAAAAGFTAVGLRISPATDGERPWPMTPGSPMLAETVRRCADTGVSVLDVEAVRLGAEPADHTAALETAAALGAGYLNAICDDPDLGRLADSFARLVAAAAPYGIRPLIEFMAYRSVRTLADAVAIAAAAGGGILIDALHVRRCGVTLDSVRAVDPALLSYVQLCDAPLARPADEVGEARGGRLLPGDGELPLADLLGELPPGLPVAVEAPPADGPPDDLDAFAARARAAADAVVSAVNTVKES